MRIDFAFAAPTHGWDVSYADYSLGQEPIIEFASGVERLPPPRDNRFGLFLKSQNRSDDLFMYITRPVTGLAPNLL